VKEASRLLNKAKEIKAEREALDLFTEEDQPREMQGGGNNIIVIYKINLYFCSKNNRKYFSFNSSNKFLTREERNK
jgi:hypothetical protein